MGRKYRVLRDWGNLNPGDELDAADWQAMNIPAAVSGGFLEPLKVRVPCEACAADKRIKKADVPSFEKAETMQEHYAKDHPALAAPDFEEA